MKKNALIILLAIFALSCNSEEYNLDSEEYNLEIVDIESILITKDNLFGNGGEGIIEQNLVITSQSMWNNLISQMNSVNNVSDNFSEIDIDFSQYKVIAIFDKIKNNGGHSLELNLTGNSENIIVNINYISPKGNVMSVITQPYHIVKISNSNLPIIFE